MGRGTLPGQVGELISPLKRLSQMRGAFYGWWLVGIGAFMMVLGTVPVFHAMPAWFVVLEQRFSWSRTQLNLAFSFSRVEGSVTGPLSGYLIEKLGSRRMVLIGMLVLGGGLLLFSQVQNLWQFYLAYITMSIGSGLGSWLPAMTLVNSWFIRRRASAMAMLITGHRLAGVLLLPVLAWAVDPDDFGPDRWRGAAAVIGIFVLVVAYPLSRLVRNRPEDYGQRPYGYVAAPASGQTAEAQDVSEEMEFTWQQAMRTKPFWIMSFGHAFTTVVVVNTMVNLGPMFSDRGFSLPTIGWIVSTYTAVGMIATLAGGYAGDRISIRMAIFGFSAIQSAAVVVILMAHNMPVAFLAAVLLGMGEGKGALISAIRGVYFGRKAFASITGISMLPMNLLLLAMPIFSGYMFDTTGSYAVPFITVAALCFIGACMFLLLGDPKPLAAPAQARQGGGG